MDCLKIPKITIFLVSRRKKLAFTNTTEKGVELWILDLETRTAKKISNDNLNANLGSPFVWLKKLSGINQENFRKQTSSLNEKKNFQLDQLFLMQTEKFHKTEHIKIC